MIVNQVIGRSFKGALAYVFGKEGSELGFSNLVNFPEDGTNKMASEFIAVASQRPNLSRSVAHIQFSPNPDDKLSDEQFEEAIKWWMEQMGYNDCLHAVAFHSDTDIRHAHLVTSRVTLNGDVVSDANNYARNFKVSRELEQRFGLTVTKPNVEVEKATPKWQRDKILPPHDYIKEAIKMVGSSGPSMPDFIRGLADLGIDAQIKFSSKAGVPQGISFSYDSYAVTGSKLGFSIKKLEQKMGVKYEPSDEGRIKEIQGGNKERDAGIFSAGADSTKTASGPGARKIERGAKRRISSVDNKQPFYVPKKLGSFAERATSAIVRFRGRFKNFGRYDRELSGVVEQQQKNGSLFKEIFRIFERRDSLAMARKKELSRTLKEGAGKIVDLDNKLGK